MPGSTGSPWNLPWPLYTEPADGAGSIQSLAEAIDDAYEDIADTLDLIQNRPGAGISTALTLAVPNNTTTVGTFATEAFDTDGMANLGVNNTILTVNTAGFYQVDAWAIFAAAAGGNRQIGIRRNGNAIYVQRWVQTATNSAQFTVIGVAYFQVGDTISVEYLQNSGGSINITNRSLHAWRVA